MSSAVIAPSHLIDLERAVALAADDRPWHKRTAWHAQAPCRQVDGTYFDHDAPAETDLARCRACQFRTECAVDGIRPCMDGLLAESRDELWGYFGGLGPDDRWSLLQQVRAHAAETGVRLCDISTQRSHLVADHFQDGRTIDWISDTLDLSREVVVDEIITDLASRGWSNRRIADVLEFKSYKWVERRRRFLGCAPLAVKVKTHEAA